MLCAMCNPQFELCDLTLWYSIRDIHMLDFKCACVQTCKEEFAIVE